MEREGKPSYLGDVNRAIEARNAQREHGRHVRNLKERDLSKQSVHLISYDEWQRLGYQKEQSQGMERGR